MPSKFSMKRGPIRTLIIKGRNKSLVLFTKFIDLCFPFVYTIHTEKFVHSIMDKIGKSAFIVSPPETLSVIEDFITENRRGVYMRFGDGDVNLATGKRDSFQINEQRLEKEMVESFSLKATRTLGLLNSGM